MVPTRDMVRALAHTLGLIPQRAPVQAERALVALGVCFGTSLGLVLSCEARDVLELCRLDGDGLGCAAAQIVLNECELSSWTGAQRATPVLSRLRSIP